MLAVGEAVPAVGDVVPAAGGRVAAGCGAGAVLGVAHPVMVYAAAMAAAIRICFIANMIGVRA